MPHKMGGMAGVEPALFRSNSGLTASEKELRRKADGGRPADRSRPHRKNKVYEVTLMVLTAAKWSPVEVLPLRVLCVGQP
jgi:hypothetical protein